MRQMLLAYNKLSFSQVYKLYRSLQQYTHHSRLPQPCVLFPVSSEAMELTSNEETSANPMEKDEQGAGPLHQSDLRSVGQEDFRNIENNCYKKNKLF